MYNLRPLNAPTSIKFTNALFIYHYYRLMPRLVCTSISHLSFRWNWRKTAGSRWTCFGVRVPRTLDYSTVNWNLCWSAPHDHNSRSSQTDGQTDRQMDILAIAWRFVLTNASRANSVFFTRFFNNVVSHCLVFPCFACRVFAAAGRLQEHTLCCSHHRLEREHANAERVSDYRMLNL